MPLRKRWDVKMGPSRSRRNRQSDSTQIIAPQDFSMYSEQGLDNNTAPDRNPSGQCVGGDVRKYQHPISEDNTEEVIRHSLESENESAADDKTSGPFASSMEAGNNLCRESSEEEEEEFLDVMSSSEEDDEDQDEDEGEEKDNPQTSSLPIDWRTFATLFNTTGPDKMTSNGFDRFTWYVNEFSPKPLSSSRTVRRNLRPVARAHAFVKTQTHSFPVDFTKAGAKAGTGKHHSLVNAPVTIVKPSDWAKMDIRTRGIKNLIFGETKEEEEVETSSSRPLFSSIETAPIVMNREEVLCSHRIANASGGVSSLKEGTKLKVVVEVDDNNSVEDLLTKAGVNDMERDGDEVTMMIIADSVQMCGKDVVSPSPENTDEPPKKKRKKKKKGEEEEPEVPKPKPKGPAFKAGDIVVQVRPHNDLLQNVELTAFLVFRYWKEEEVEDPVMSLVLLNRGETIRGNLPENAFRRLDVVEVIETDGIGFIGVERPCAHQIGNVGRLRDGRLFVVYRFLLYADGFTPQVGKKSSVGGCYMLPLGICQSKRISVGVIRQLGLTPPGVSTNHVLQYIIDDIVTGAREGFTTTDSDGQEVVIFLDCVGYIADYPAITEALDVLGHNSNVPCHLCSFYRYDKSGRGFAAYGYTSDINSSHPSYARSGYRSSIIRHVDVKDSDLNAMGLREQSRYMASILPLHNLCERLEAVRDSIPITRKGARVVPGIFDPYRSCVIAPDHLFLGMAQNVLSCVIKLMPRGIRKIAHAQCLRMLRENFLFYQKELFDTKKKEVHSMSISAMYSFLLVAPYAFRSAWNRSDDATKGSGRTRQNRSDALELLESFQKLVSLTQYCPSPTVDGIGMVREYNKCNGNNRLVCLKIHADHYISKLSSLCRSSEIAEDVLDKPNVHRLSEFYTFTLPAFGSIALIQELVLEHGHQLMKQSYKATNGKNVQLQCMAHATGVDWVNRFAVELEGLSRTGEGWDETRCRAVLRLMGRPEWAMYPIPEELSTRVRHAFTDPVLRDLSSRKKSFRSMLSTLHYWDVEKPIAAGDNCEVKNARRFIARQICTRRGDHDGENVKKETERVSIHAEAKWVVRYGKLKGRKETKLVLRHGDIIQSLSSLTEEELADGDSYIIDSSSSQSTAVRRFWMVVACYSHSDPQALIPFPQHISVFALVLPCLKDEVGWFVNNASRPRVLLPLLEGVRRVMVVHACSQPIHKGKGLRGNQHDDGQKAVDADNDGGQHSGQVDSPVQLEVNKCSDDGEMCGRSFVSGVKGDRFVIVGRVEGYPPRSA